MTAALWSAAFWGLLAAGVSGGFVLCVGSVLVMRARRAPAERVRPRRPLPRTARILPREPVLPSAPAYLGPTFEDEEPHDLADSELRPDSSEDLAVPPSEPVEQSLATAPVSEYVPDHLVEEVPNEPLILETYCTARCRGRLCGWRGTARVRGTFPPLRPAICPTCRRARVDLSPQFKDSRRLRRTDP